MTTPIRPDMPLVMPLERNSPAAAGAPTDGASFGDLLGRALGGVEATQNVSHDVLGAFVRGDPVEMHQVMAAAEEASLSLQLLVETRNKLTEAYRSLMNTQV